MIVAWSNQIFHGDCLDVMRALPDGCCSLTFTSPPYEDCRLYKPLEFKAKGQGWVDWMIPRVVEMCRVTAGLVFINAAGKVRQFKYSPVVEWLVADLTRNHGIVCGPAPYVFHRVGIPGSGGPDWLRNDWEWIVCVSRPGKLPWSDNTACGHRPKWALGGEMGHRVSDGARVNQWGHSIASGATTVADDGVVRSKGTMPSHYVAANGKRKAAVSRIEASNGDLLPRSKRKQRDGIEPKVAAALENGIPKGGKLTTKDNGKGEMRTQLYLPPPLGNPGNVIHCKVGGGLMGHPLAHENEAPFPEKLADFFTLSFCPPGGVVADPFSGSGTTLASALKHGRRAVGCDLRESQIALTKRRIETVQPVLMR